MQQNVLESEKKKDTIIWSYPMYKQVEEYIINNRYTRL